MSDETEVIGNKQIMKRLERRCQEGWIFAKSWAFTTSGLLLFIILVGIWVFHSDIDKLPQMIHDGIIGCGIAVFLYAIVNAWVGYAFWKENVKDVEKDKGNMFRRKFCPGVDDNPNIEKRQATVVNCCTNCSPRYTDFPELVIMKNNEGDELYQVRCPKCWRHTQFYTTQEKAEFAWNEGKVFELNHSDEDEDDEQ